MHRYLAGMTMLVTLLVPGTVLAQEITGPEQSAGWPGGRVYRYDEVVGEHFGELPTGYWLFEPLVGAAEEAERPPHTVVILLHGYSATDPAFLRAWIDHLVRQGRVVIFPDYQTDDPLGEPPLEYTGNMIDGVAAALAELESGDHVETRLDDLAVAGYSMGGVLALNYAAMAVGLGLPVPIAVMAVTPGGCTGCGGPGGSNELGVPYRDLSRIETATKLLLIVGEDDDFVGERPAQVAWERTTQIPSHNRDYLVARSDGHGTPALVADHTFPSNAGPLTEVDALDWYGTFKWLDGLFGCAAQPPICDDTMNGGPTQLDMGEWSDGTPVNPSMYVEHP